MNELVEYAQSIIAFLEQDGSRINVGSQRALAELLQNIMQVIEEQTPEGAPPATPNQQVARSNPEIDEAMPSSNIAAFGYDNRNGNLLVRFLGKYPNRNGPIYSYSGVPPNIFEIFRRGAIPARTNGRNRWGEWWQGKYPSMGAAMYHVIRAGGYPYQRISG